MLIVPEADWICVVGVCYDFYEKFRPQLDAEPKRRLVFLDIHGEASSFPHAQVYVYSGLTQQEMNDAAKKIGWKSVFQTVAVLDLAGVGNRAGQFEKSLLQHKEAAHLLLSDWADAGESVLKHALSHWRSLPEVRSGLCLKNRFKGIPAIICGGGPSLKKNAHLLDREKALIFAGGAALNQLPIEPHFAASIDREAPFSLFKCHSFWQTPFFYQSRMSPQNFSLLHGEKCYVPDGSYPAEAWFAGEDLFDGGWTVGTFLASMAVLLGCDPIVYVGMDLCYEGNKKYAFCKESALKDGLITTLDREGKLVWTQRDWVMAAHWISELAAKRWDRTFINATEGGVAVSPQVQVRGLKDVLDSWTYEMDLLGLVHSEIMGLEVMPIPLDKIEEWQKSLKTCLTFCKKSLKKQVHVAWDREIVYQKLLYPLWQIWSPIFERELDVDAQPLPLEEKMRLNQILFFQRVLYEQAN